MKLLIRDIAIFLLLLGATLSKLCSQSETFDEPWRWVHFTVESGLPSNYVSQVFEATDGTVWAATAAGLAWYDGFQWVTTDSMYGLPQNRSVNIFDQVGDSLFIKCGQYYLGTKTGFRQITELQQVMGAIPFSGRSILAQENASLFQYENNHLKPFEPGSALTEGKSMSLWRTLGGGIWASFVDGLYKREDGSWKCKMKADSTIIGVMGVVENARGSGIAWVNFPSEKRGLWEWQKNSPLLHDRSEKVDNIKSLDIGPNDEAIAVYQSDELRIRREGIWHPLILGQSQIREILTVTIRANGDLWIATEHGLFLYKRSSSRWTYWRHESPDLRNSVNELFKAHDGSLWVGTSDGIEVHHSNGTVEMINAMNRKPLYVITGLNEDADGNMWVSSGSSFSGAYRWDGSQWKHYNVSDDPGGIRIHKIRKDRKGRLWFLGIGKYYPPLEDKQPGAYVLEKGHFTRWGTDEGLINGRVYSFAEGKDGTRWFGTFGGLSRWRNGEWTHWTTNQGLHSLRVFTLDIDDKNTVWFGDRNERNGLAFIDPNDSVRYLTTADGLINDKIWDLKADDFGKLWITTRGGLSCYDHGVWSTFDEKSGLRQLSLWPVLPLKDEVYVGTMGKGVAILHRDESTTPNPRILLDKPLMEGKNVVLRWKAFAYLGELSPSDVLTRIRINDGSWSAWEKKYEIILRDLMPGDYVYQVQAKGLFGNFDEEGARGSFSIPLPLHLRPFFLIPTGALTLIVIVLGFTILSRKRQHDLELRKSEEKFRTVAEMTPTAIWMYHKSKLLFVNSGAEILTGYSKAELLGKDLFDIVHPSDQELLRVREMDRSGNTSVPSRYEYKITTKRGDIRWVDFTSGWIKFQGIPVRLGTALDITERKQAEEKLRLLASELSLTEERERRQMASYLHDVIGQTLALCKIKIRSLQRSVSLGNGTTLLQELRELVEQSIYDTQSLTFELCPPILYELSLEAAIEWLSEQMQQQHKIEFRFIDDKQAKPVVDELRIVLFQAVREVFMNVIKHANAQRVTVGVLKENTNIRIDIQDNGIGFDSSAQTNSTDAGGGFGLFNIRERLAYLGGKVEISSWPHAGTTVTIKAPLNVDGVSTDRSNPQPDTRRDIHS
ncbi:MAG: PAS domain S-box protein [Ignavibacteria bacterium]|nr:PAS domain S-box protein [Ignavibacteria bacterium]